MLANVCVYPKNSMGVWGENETGVVWEATWSLLIPLSFFPALRTTWLKMFGNLVQKIKVTDKVQELLIHH